MPDKRQPAANDSSLSSGATLIARRQSNRKEPFRLATRSGSSGSAGSAIADDVAEWLDETGQTTESLARMEQIRKDNGRLYQRLMTFADDWAKVRVLHALVEEPDGVGYEKLEDYTNASRRTIRKYLDRLEDMGAIQRGGKPLTVSFDGEEAYLLAADVTAYR